eukprot:364258-Chlamydomonas_euryale.AAC.8
MPAAAESGRYLASRLDAAHVLGQPRHDALVYPGGAVHAHGDHVLQLLQLTWAVRIHQPGTVLQYTCCVFLQPPCDIGHDNAVFA